MGATDADCPRRQPRPGTPWIAAAGSGFFLSSDAGSTLLMRQDREQHARKLGANSVLSLPASSPESLAVAGRGSVCGGRGGAGAISGCRPKRSRRAKLRATSSKRLRLQPYTCCALAHQVARPPGGGAPLGRSGRRAPAPPLPPQTLPPHQSRPTGATATPDPEPQHPQNRRYPLHQSPHHSRARATTPCPQKAALPPLHPIVQVIQHCPRKKRDSRASPAPQ